MSSARAKTPSHAFFKIPAGSYRRIKRLKITLGASRGVPCIASAIIARKDATILKVWSTPRILTAYLVLFIYVCGLFAFSTVTFRIGIRHYFHHFSRLFGKTYLALVGIRLTSPNQDILDQRCARVVTINHSSQLDFFSVQRSCRPGAQ